MFTLSSLHAHKDKIELKLVRNGSASCLRKTPGHLVLKANSERQPAKPSCHHPSHGVKGWSVTCCSLPPVGSRNRAENRRSMRIQSGQFMSLHQHSSVQARKCTPVMLCNRNSHLNKALSQRPRLWLAEQTLTVCMPFMELETSASDNTWFCWRS